MENIIAGAVLIAIIAFAAWYVIRAKKNGQKCIGCPNGCKCSHESSCSGGCGCCGSEQKD